MINKVFLALVMLSISVNAQVPFETRSIFFDSQMNRMSIGLKFCGIVSKSVECGYNYKEDTLYVYKFVDSSWAIKHEDKSYSEQCDILINEDEELRNFKFMWLSKDNGNLRLFATLNPYLQGFFDEGMVPNINGKNGNQAISDWIEKNFRVYAFIGHSGDGIALSDEDGIVCTYRLNSDKYISTRRTTIQSFLENLN